ncbi:MarR family transcriptional regulator [Streptomyces canus]|uniref:MarR family transcriptional regulator n=1 Tax=Streptomyces canus TaxID=58343 RepID=A0A101RLY0_9ACTN|nr:MULTISPECIES: MarR family transcriptional regulator [Streptomyces]KUN58055.1 MarR family transcriptional regulator [Streptomyces canus]MDI5907755.1 MarR family transcriptional regulator [Streptomyces sp. 12257]
MGYTRWLTGEETRAWMAFFSAAALLNRRLDQQLKDDADLTHVQYEILSRLSGAVGHELRMTELAESVYASQSGVTYQITQLEKAGLVRRRICPSGPRAVYAVLTDAGLATIERAAPGHVTAVRELLIDVLTPEQLTALADGLGRARDRMLGQ